MDALRDELQALFDAVGACFGANEFDRLRTLWDPEDEQPFYLAEEHDTLVADRAALEAYWAITREVNGGCEARWRVEAAKPIGPDHASAMFTLEWRIHVRGLPRRYGGACRGQALLRRTDAGWRFRSYAEAPLAPITYLKKLYERVGETVV
jgi:hypothetical protein